MSLFSYSAVIAALVLGGFWYSRKSQVAVANAAGETPPGIISSTGITVLNSITNVILYARRFATWFKSNYWHAFVAGLLAMWLALMGYNFVTHPLSFVLGKLGAQQMVGLAPVSPLPIAAETPPIVDAAKAIVNSPAPEKPKKHKKAKVRANVASSSISIF